MRPDGWLQQGKVPLELQTDRLGVLLDQFDISVDIARQRLEGLGDAEYLWQPSANAWTIRPRAEAATPMAFGAGEWVLDFAPETPGPPPVATIAWRLGHLQWGLRARHEWTFGSRSRRPEECAAFSPIAAEGLASLWEAAASWRDGLATLTDAQLDTVGFGQFPYGLDPTLPFIGIVWWVNRELIHHTAEIALLRDLWENGLGR